MDGFIYIIHADGTSRYKIGKTKSDPRKRVQDLQTGSAHRLRLVDYVNVSDMDAVETSLHNKYKAYRINGEWFELPDVQNIVNDMRGIRVSVNDRQDYNDAAVLEKLDYLLAHIDLTNRYLRDISDELSTIAMFVERVASTFPEPIDTGEWWTAPDFENIPDLAE